MPTVTGGVETEISVLEAPQPISIDPQMGVSFVPFDVHREAKRRGKTVRVNSINCRLTITWLNKFFPKVGHTFFFKVADERGNLQQVMQMGPEGSQEVSIANLYPSNNRNGIFGLIGVQLDGVSFPSVILVYRDDYKVRCTITVNYDVL